MWKILEIAGGACQFAERWLRKGLKAMFSDECLISLAVTYDPGVWAAWHEVVEARRQEAEAAECKASNDKPPTE